MAYIVRVNEKFVAPEGLARRSRATRFDSCIDATKAGCAATCDPYDNEKERVEAWTKALDNFEVVSV
jgi:hypothetical protein